MGLKKNNPGCQCCNLIPPCDCYSVSVPHDHDHSDVSVWELSVAGLTDDNCNACDDWNGDFELCWDVDNLRWDSAASTSTSCGHVNGEPLWRLSYTAPNYILEARGLSYEWALGAPSWVPFGTNTVSQSGIDPIPNPCNNKPTTLDLVPCMGASCVWCDATPESPISVTLGGWADRLCTCTGLNQTWLLDRRVNPFTNDCVWTGFELFDCPGGWLGAQGVATVLAQVIQGGYPISTKWQVVVAYEATIFDPAIGPVRRYSRARYEWDSGDTAQLDCTVQRSLTLVWEFHSQPQSPCFLPSGTCTVN